MNQTEPNKLSKNQIRAMPFLVGARNIEEGRKLAGVSHWTIHRWLKIPAFRDVLDRTRDRVINESLDRLKAGITRAVDVLTEMMEGADGSLKIRAAERILDHFWRIKELQELETLLKRVEERAGSYGPAI
jgi:hypothetical protein